VLLLLVVMVVVLVLVVLALAAAAVQAAKVAGGLIGLPGCFVLLALAELLLLLRVMQPLLLIDHLGAQWQQQVQALQILLLLMVLS
jgi:hypothetical protein